VHARHAPMQLPRVLVIDHEPLLLEVIVAALGEDTDVFATVHPREVLARIESGERYDVILVDVCMPSMDGFALFDRIAAMCPFQARRVMFMAGGALTSGHRQPASTMPVDVAVLEAIARTAASP
jgi:two-component system, NtrC family, sensor kinase